MSIVEYSMSVSLMFQILSGMAGVKGSFMTVPAEHQPLVDILRLETGVQFVEAAFYAWALKSAIELKTLASRRYMDWVLTTPTMLVSTIMFMKYLEGENNIKKYKKEIIEILIYNLGMLIFGYLGETGTISKTLSISLGFACFAKSFHLIYKHFGSKTEKGKKLFTFLLVVWGLYGVAAMAPTIQKNVSYNMLDIIAKNFYGIYIYYKVHEVHDKSTLQTRSDNK